MRKQCLELQCLEGRESGDEPHLRKQRPKENWEKKSEILKEYHECTNCSALSNLLTMATAAQPPARNPKASSSIGKAREGCKNGIQVLLSRSIG